MSVYACVRALIRASISFSGYLVCTTPPTVLCECFRNFKGVFSWSGDVQVVWIQSADYYYYFLPFFRILNSAIFHAEILSTCIDSRYLVCRGILFSQSRVLSSSCVQNSYSFMPIVLKISTCFFTIF